MDSVFVIVVISALGPVIGSAIGVARQAPLKWVCNMLCFAAGVMLAISFLELIPESLKLGSVWIVGGGILVGTLLMYLLDKIIPHIHPEMCAQEQGCNLDKTATFLLAGIAMHNFPEGMAIAIGGLADAKVSVTIALAIAIHNIPEGICTSSPYYLASGNRLRSFLISSATAIPIIAGYLAGKYLFAGISEAAMALIISSTAGLMIYISSDELIPTSCLGGQSHATIFSLMAGVLFVILLGL